MLRRLTTVIAIEAVVLATLAIAAPVARAGDPLPAATYYLALGDSVAAGFQPNRGLTSHGYVDVLARRVRKDMIPDLELRNVACPGETSRSLITGERSLCDYPEGSQLDAAIAFLEAHPGQVAFITITIGGNDLLNRCLERGVLIPKPCAADLAPRLGERVIEIVDALQLAGGSGVPIVGMTYYDPFLGLWGLIPGGRQLARADQRAWRVFDGGLAVAYGDAGAAVADVAATFRVEDWDETLVVPGRGRIPVNVALACRWTWFCSERYTGDPHPNKAGYRRIAGTFEPVIDDLVET